MKTPHLTSAFFALMWVAIVIAGFVYRVESLEADYVHALAPRSFPQKLLGSAVQKQALLQPDLLLFYGSSDVWSGGPYNAAKVFERYPTGFMVFPVGSTGTDAISILQELAAAGNALRGKKIAITLSTDYFLKPMADPAAYAFNFSLLDAYELAFSSDLSLTLKQQVAARMLDYPETLAKDAFLEYALERLADGSLMSTAFYCLAFPLGKVRVWLLRLQDHWETLQFISEQDRPGPVIIRQKSELAWADLFAQAGRDYSMESNNNLFGIENSNWDKYRGLILKRKNTFTNSEFKHELRTSQEWHDLDLLLGVVKELGGKPLLLTLPLDGTYYDYTGVTNSTRRKYYDRLRQVGQVHDVPTVCFEDHEYDRLFFNDVFDHPSLEGAAYYDQALDAFYHNNLQQHPC